MIGCHEIQSLIERQLNHELRRKEKRTFQEHIRHCPDCQAEFEKWQKMEKALSCLPKMKCPDEVLGSIYSNTFGFKQKTVHQVRFRIFPRHARWKWAGAAVALGLILIFTIIHPIINQNKIEKVTYTQEEILRAREQARWSLTYAAQVLEKSEKKAIDDALMIQLPQTVRKVVKNTVPILKGGS